MRRVFIFATIVLAVTISFFIGFTLLRHRNGGDKDQSLRQSPTTQRGPTSIAISSDAQTGFVSDTHSSSRPSLSEERAVGTGQLSLKDILEKPASFWNLSLREHVVIRARTLRMLEVPKDAKNPLDFPPVTLAVLDISEDIKAKDGFDPQIQKLLEVLLDQKIFTAAAPVVIFWSLYRDTGKPRWSVGVPIEPRSSTLIKPPLRLSQIPGFRAHVVRLTTSQAKEMIGKVENGNLYEVCRVIGHALLRQAALSIEPKLAILRFPKVPLGPPERNAELEVFFVLEFTQTSGGVSSGEASANLQ